MEQCSPFSWSYCYLDEGIEEFKNSILYSTLELEAAILSAHEQISRKDDEIIKLKGVLANLIKERDQFQTKCKTLVFEKHLLLQQVQMQPKCTLSSGTTSNEDDNIAPSQSPSNRDEITHLHSSHGDKCPTIVPVTQHVIDVIDQIVLKKPVPENGKFLQAVTEAGPLLQTLLLAGPLPQWEHPPPPLNSIDIPLVTISSPISINSGHFNNKRPLMMIDNEVSDFSLNSKYQKVVHQSSLTQHLVSS